MDAFYAIYCKPICTTEDNIFLIDFTNVLYLLAQLKAKEDEAIRNQTTTPYALQIKALEPQLKHIPEILGSSCLKSQTMESVVLQTKQLREKVEGIARSAGIERYVVYRLLAASS